MHFYNLLRPALFALEPETAHNLAISALKLGIYPPFPQRRATPTLAQTIAGITFPNPLGLAAGFDKNAECIPALWKAGFGFIECGTVTPKPQMGNPKPRLFRLAEDGAVINRLGFNNQGIEAFMRNINNISQYTDIKPIFGINIGKNKDTEDPAADYLQLLDETYNRSAYITINISSPNTPGLRSIQAAELLEGFLKQLMSKVKSLEEIAHVKTPVFLKIAPDISEAELSDICKIALAEGLDGLILTNTTLARPEYLKSPLKSEQGGLSGRPLMPLSTERLRAAFRLTEGKIPLIGVGGVASAEDAWTKMEAGASLVQLYSALVYQGFGLVARILNGLEARLKQQNLTHIGQIIGRRA